MQLRTLTWLALVVSFLHLGFGPSAIAGEQREWVASNELADIRLEASYREDLNDDTVDQRLQIRLDNVTPNTRITVMLNGQVIGGFRTADNGSGEFMLVRSGAPVGDDGRPIGPRINDGDVLTVARGRLKLNAMFMEK